MTAATPGSAALLALAERIKRAIVVSLTEQPKTPGPVWAMPLGDDEQAAIVDALRIAAEPDEDGVRGLGESLADKIIGDPKVVWLRECGFQSAARFESELRAAVIRACQASTMGHPKP